jgi:hypothetical protein
MSWIPKDFLDIWLPSFKVKAQVRRSLAEAVRGCGLSLSGSWKSTWGAAKDLIERHKDEARLGHYVITVS